MLQIIDTKALHQPVKRTCSIDPESTWGIDVSGTAQGAGGVGGLLASTLHDGASSQTFLPSFDGNGNISAWSDPGGALLTRTDYSPFGQVVARYRLGPPGDTRPDRLAFGFSTKYTDAESGLLYYGYRYLDPVSGRWLSRDPIGENGGVNLYGFVGNGGTGYVDVLGFAPCPCDCDGAPDLTDDIDKVVNSLISNYKGNTAKGLRMEIINKFLKGGVFEKGLRRKGKKCRNSWEASTFTVCGRCVGSDKFGHFLEDGMNYYDIAYTHGKGESLAEKFGKWTEGINPGVLTRDEYDFLNSPNISLSNQGVSRMIPNAFTRDIYGIFGDNVPGFPNRLLDPKGSASPADLAANKSGLEFWKKIYSSDYGDGGSRFGKFSICDYVNDDWDQTKNENIKRDPKPPRP